MAAGDTSVTVEDLDTPRQRRLAERIALLMAASQEAEDIHPNETAQFFAAFVEAVRDERMVPEGEWDRVMYESWSCWCGWVGAEAEAEDASRMTWDLGRAARHRFDEWKQTGGALAAYRVARPSRCG